MARARVQAPIEFFDDRKAQSRDANDDSNFRSIAAA